MRHFLHTSPLTLLSPGARKDTVNANLLPKFDWQYLTGCVQPGVCILAAQVSAGEGQPACCHLMKVKEPLRRAERYLQD